MKENVDIVAKAAESVYRKIKALRKELPQTNKSERKEFERQVKVLQNGWYEEIKHLLIKK